MFVAGLCKLYIRGTAIQSFILTDWLSHIIFVNSQKCLCLPYWAILCYLKIQKKPPSNLIRGESMDSGSEYKGSDE